MDGFYLSKLRTDGMAPSDVRQAIWDGTIKICPYENLRYDEIDAILEGFLYRGSSRSEKKPICMVVKALGLNPGGMPLAEIAIHGETASRGATPALCTYCPRFDSVSECGKADSFLIYDVLQDDPAWNADALADDDD